MSNPAVITLVNTSDKKGKFKRFVIEDNIGESIHLHIENMRVDFTIKEFLEFSQMIRESLHDLDFLQGYNLESFDEHFLKECADLFPKLKSIEIEEIKLSDMQCIVHSNYRSDLNLLKIVPISKTPAYKYLQGDKKDFLQYGQYNYLGMDNEKRLLETLKSIEENKYPYKDKYIVLFNGQNLIRDGQHRAAILAYLYGLDSTIKVMRFNFFDNNHIMKINNNNFKTAFLWFSKKVYKKLKRYLKRCSQN
jgi:hypothetical protein